MLKPKEWTARMHKITDEHTKTGYRRKKNSQEKLKECCSLSNDGNR